MGDTKQIQREALQQKANMKSLEKAVSGYKMMDAQEYAFKATREEAWTRETRNKKLVTFGIEYLPDNERGLIYAQDAQRQLLLDDVRMIDKQRKKKKDQEQDATTRARRNGYTYTREQLDPRGLMKSNLKKVRENLQMPKEDEALETYDSVNTFESPLISMSFSNVPAEAKIAEMLTARNKLAIYLKRAPQELNDPDADVIIAHKRDMYQKLDEALQTYYTAYGVDFKTGKELSGKKVLQARQHIALAVENFEEAFDNQIVNLAEARLNKMRKDKNYQRRLKELTGADIAKMKADGLPNGTVAQIGSPEHNALVHIRRLITENPERYQANKEKINQLFAELTNCANTVSSINRQMTLAAQMLDEMNDNGKSATALRTAKDHPNLRDGRRKTSLLRQVTRLESALNYFLTGQEPEMFDEALFLQNRFQMETSTYNNFVGPKSEVRKEAVKRTRASAAALAKAEKEAEEAGQENVAAQRKLEKIRSLNEGTLSDKLLAVSYEDAFKNAQTMAVTPISDQKQEASPTDYQEKMTRCRKRKKDYYGRIEYIRNLKYAMDETFSEYTGVIGPIPLLKDDNEFADYNHIGALNFYIQDVSNRKKPLDPVKINEIRSLEANMKRTIKMEKEKPKKEKAAKKLGMDYVTYILQNMDPLVYFGEEPFPNDVADILQGFQEEIELCETGKADIEAFVQQHQEAFKANLTPQERMANYSVVYLLGRKAKSLESRVSTFRYSPYYKNLSEEDQERFPHYHEYFGGIKHYVELYARVINSYDPSSAPVTWSEADLHAMSLNLSDYQEDYIRRSSGHPIDWAKIKA